MKAGEVFVAINGDINGLKSSLNEANSISKKSAQQISQNMASIGKGLTIVGGAISLISIGLIKAASDAEETASKFAVVFKEVSDEAKNAAKNLTDNFGLSSNAAKKLLSDTGDLLTGFGFSGTAALDLSEKVNKLAVDLASFTNYSGGAAGASAALTKALLGERESVKSLGISILETDVQAKILEMTQKGITFGTGRQAKAYATLEIAMKQSKNAIGDFSRTQGGFANQWRILQSRINDVVVELGNALLPTATKLVGMVTNLVSSISKWIESHKTLTDAIVLTGATLGVLAAVGGPILMAVSAYLIFKLAINAATASLALHKTAMVAARNTSLYTMTGIIPMQKVIMGLTANWIIWNEVIREYNKVLKNAKMIEDSRDAGIKAQTEAMNKLAKAYKLNAEQLAIVWKNYNEGKADLLEGVSGISDQISKDTTAFGDIAEALNEVYKKMQPSGDEPRVFNPYTSEFIESQEDYIKRIEENNQKVKESYEKLAESMQPVYDRLFEMQHTDEENAVYNLKNKRDAQIAYVQSLNLSKKEEAKAITEINNLYKAEVDAIIGKINESKEAKLKEIDTTIKGELAKMKAIREGIKPYYELIEKVSSVADATENSAQRQVAALQTIITAQGALLTNQTNIQSAGSYEEAQAIVAGQGPAPIPPIPSYQSGTPFVPQTGLYKLHQGERVLTPAENKTYNRSYSPTVNITVQGNGDVSSIKKAVEQALEESSRQYGRRGYELIPGIA